jgi:hypothetical protein
MCSSRLLFPLYPGRSWVVLGDGIIDGLDGLKMHPKITDLIDKDLLPNDIDYCRKLSVFKSNLHA